MSLHPPDLEREAWLKTAMAWVDRGFHVHQKWDCKFCTSRQTMEGANRFYTKGVCEECGKTSDIFEAGLLAVNKPCVTMNDSLPLKGHFSLEVVISK